MKKNKKNTKKILEKIEQAKKQIFLVKDSINERYNSQYISLNKLLRTIEPVLSSNGLIILNKIKGNNLAVMVIDMESKEKISTEIPLIYKSDDMQSLASAITYGRRYALMTLLNLIADDMVDDDGNLAIK